MANITLNITYGGQLADDQTFNDLKAAIDSPLDDIDQDESSRTITKTPSALKIVIIISDAISFATVQTVIGDIDAILDPTYWSVSNPVVTSFDTNV